MLNNVPLCLASSPSLWRWSCTECRKTSFFQLCPREYGARHSCNMLEHPGRYMTLGVVLLSFDGLWWGSIVHLVPWLPKPSSRVVTWTSRAVSLITTPCTSCCGCIHILKSPHWSLISCVLVLACLGRLRFRCGRLVQARPSSPPCWSWSASVGLRFSFPLPFQGLPVLG